MEAKNLFSRKANKPVNFLQGVLLVDPGLIGTGWAYWTALPTFPIQKNLVQGLRDASEYCPRGSGVLRPGGDVKDWVRKADEVSYLFAAVLKGLPNKVQTVILEMPELWAGSAKSQAAAASNALFSLTYLVGCLGLTARQHTNTLPILVYPKMWKGQLPKKTIINRIKKVFPNYNNGIIRDHEADAIGMGLAIMGMI